MLSQIKSLRLFLELGGSATKGVPDAGRVSILVDLPANRESEFRAAVASIGGETPGSSAPAKATPATVRLATSGYKRRKSFVVQIVEKQ